MIRSLRGGLALALAGVLTSLAGGAPATAAPDPSAEPGLWYLYQLGIDEIHASGITGEGVTIAIIDGPINLEVPTLQGANIEVQDSFCFDESGVREPGTTTELYQESRHGTAVTSLVVGTGAGYSGQVGVMGVAPGAKVLYYNRGDDKETIDEITCWDEGGNYPPAVDVLALSIEDAVARGADIISMSFMVGTSPELDAAVATALREGVILVAGMSNHSSLLEIDSPPGIQNGVVSVLSGASDGTLQVRSNGQPNTSDYVDVVAPGVGILVQGTIGSGWETPLLGQGTSFATPIVAGNLALVMQKYPDATPNQILQSMIHNTGTGPHDLDWDATLGYGTVVAGTLLAADPKQYEDVNPFIKEDVDLDEGPTIAEIFGDATPTPTAATTPTPNVTAPVEGDGSSLAPLVLIGGIVLLAIVAVILIIVIIAARKPKEGARHG